MCVTGSSAITGHRRADIAQPRLGSRVHSAASRELESRVARIGDLVAPTPVLRDSGRIAHVHALLAGNVAAVVPRAAARVYQDGGRDECGGLLDPLLLRLGQRL